MMIILGLTFYKKIMYQLLDSKLYCKTHFSLTRCSCKVHLQVFLLFFCANSIILNEPNKESIHDLLPYHQPILSSHIPHNSCFSTLCLKHQASR